MREITQYVYNFNELSKEIQEKLIEKEKEYQKTTFCNDCLSEEMAEKAKILLKQYFGEKATFKDVYYSLNYCQGDGSMIEFEVLYYNKLISIKQYGRYYHEKSFELYNNELTEKQEKQLKNKIYKMNNKLTQYGYNLIESEPFRDDIIEILQEYEYFSDGSIY